MNVLPYPAFPPDLVFGPYTLRCGEKLLLRGDVPVRLGGRALDLLVALTAQAGAVVGRDELVAQVWPTSVVEDTSLRFHVSALRKAIGDGQDGARYIANVPGRGYSFVAPVHVVTRRDVATGLVADAGPVVPSAAATPSASVANIDLPSRLTTVIGRDDVVTALVAMVRERRLVTIVGAGGVGKTTVALEAARACAQDFADGVHWIDLASADDASCVTVAVARGLGVDAADAAEPARLSQAIHLRIGRRRLLIVLDNCEHVIDAATQWVEGVLLTHEGASILATSREPLDAQGEWVHRLQPLAMPPSGTALTVDEALAFDAVALLADRASASASDFSLGDDQLPHAVALCRLLDGNPLAIELAAATVGSLGLKGLVDRPDDLTRLLSRGRRTAHLRQGSVQASLDWSHRLLCETDRAVLRRLSVFERCFDLSAAAPVAALDTARARSVDGTAVFGSVMSLSARSMLSALVGEGASTFALPHMARRYAADRLVESGEERPVRTRHAEYFLDRLRQAPASLDRGRCAELAQAVRADVTAAIAWASTEPGRQSLATALSDAFDALLAGRSGAPTVHGVETSTPVAAPTLGSARDDPARSHELTTIHGRERSADR